MGMVRSTAYLALGFVLSSCSCTSSAQSTRSHPEPTVADLVAYLNKNAQQLRSFRNESIMEYWQGEKRVKGTVWILSKQGSKVRFNALNPTGDSVAIDLACNGDSFVYIDSNNNCQKVGQCNRSAIARLLGIGLEPEEFLLLANGLTPTIGTTGRIAWDAKAGLEILTLQGAGENDGLVQTTKLRHHESGWDVVSSQVTNKNGAIQWQVANKNFKKATTVDGKQLRVPSKSLFKQPKQKSDLLVKWQSRQLNVELEEERFVLEPIAGLAGCP